jgi:acylglycerol lipase
MGHSMGGGEVLTLASTPKYQDLMPEICGFILESPFVALAFKANPFTVFAGRIAGKLLPHKQIKQPIPPKDLTRDPAVIKSLDDDAMCDGTGTLEMFANMLDRASRLDKGELKLNKGVQSIWIGHGTHDLATSYPASKKWLESQSTVPDKTFKSYDGWYHQLHADLPDLQPLFAKDVGDWILEKIGGASATATKEPETETAAPTDAAVTSEETPAESGADGTSALPVEEHAKL